MSKGAKPPESFKEVVDVLIGEMSLTRRKIETLIALLDEKGIISKEEYKNKLREKTEEEKLGMLISSASTEINQR